MFEASSSCHTTKCKEYLIVSQDDGPIAWCLSWENRAILGNMRACLTVDIQMVLRNSHMKVPKFP